MLNLNSILIGSENPKALTEFYKKILGKPTMDDGDWSGWLVGSAFLSVGPHSDIKGGSKEPARVMFNFETKEVKEEFERIKKLGAKVIKAPYGMTQNGEVSERDDAMWIATFADPDGNYFQLVSPWEGSK